MATEETILPDLKAPRRKRGQASVDVVRECLKVGMTNKQIARVAGISVSVVKWHCSRIYQQVGAANRVQAAIKLRA